MNGSFNLRLASSKTRHHHHLLLLLISPARCVSLLESYAHSRSLPKLKQLHALIITFGLVCLSSHKRSTLLRSNLATTYALCGVGKNARKLFDGLPQPGLFLCNAMIRNYSQNDEPQNVLGLFSRILSSGEVLPNKFTYPFVIKACGDLELLKAGVVVHGKAVMGGFDGDMYVLNCLLAMYMNCGKVGAARWVFDKMRERSLVSYNTMIAGYVRNACPDEAILLFNQMMDLGVEYDSVTMVSILPACGQLKELALGRQLHVAIQEKDLGSNFISVWNSVIHMYAKCGSIEEGRAVFDAVSKKDVVTWTTMINGYVLNGDERTALELWWPMQLEGVKPNAVTTAALISACANRQVIKAGMCLHGWTIKELLDDDVIVKTALIDMYAQCSRLSLGFMMLRRVSERRTAPWNAILSGCAHNGLPREAIKHFKQMLDEEIDLDGATFSCLLPAYANLADLRQAYNIHGYLLKSGHLSLAEVTSGLVDLFSRCGNLELAHRIFEQIPSNSRDTIHWSVLIAGYADNGDGETAVSLLKQMMQSDVRPNEVTLTSVLNACSHAGLVDEGLDLFKLFLKEHEVTPCTDHYACMVDLLGRVGRLEEAYKLISTMSCPPTPAVWGAMLSACVIHENVSLGEMAARMLFHLEPENMGNYVLMARLYAAAGRWKDAECVRSMINDMGLRKTAAHSLIY